ncbi:MAG: CpaF family protein [Oscillospiraceae bacterium]|nr:CpaF family protein [Oscillospiraceae bacterium]
MELTVDFLDELCRKTAHVLEGQKDVTDEQIKDTAYKVYKAAAPEHYITVDERLYVSNYVFNNMRKLGPLQTILDDHTITEVMINGPDTIFIEKNGRLQKADVHFNSARQLEDIIQRIVATVNRTVDMANPICDARLEDGSRVNIVLPPVALNGPIVTIRKFPDKVIQFDDLIRWNSVTPEAAAFLKSAVEAKYNIFVSGGTGSGKTTFLNALSNFIPKDERIITIEDSAELQIKTIPNLVRLETRNANAEGKGAVTIRDLIRSSLRMRPERIVVGEVRGAEALDMLQAMNTGHDGSLSTGHANSPQDMLSRLETMVLTGSSFPIEAIRQQIGSAVDIIVHLGRLSDKSRRTLNIDELIGYENGEYVMNPLFEFRRQPDLVNGKIVGGLVRTENPLHNTHKFEMSGVQCRGL